LNSQVSFLLPKSDNSTVTAQKTCYLKITASVWCSCSQQPARTGRIP